jgi:peptidoglycan/xylan/chitin deacetylase (PgdA/CDA1 family)
MAGDDVLNICFHGIGPPQRDLEEGENQYWVDTDRYLRLMDEIATWPSVRISFDDANVSDARIGLPALVERGLRAQFFLLAGRLGAPGSLSTDDVRELMRAGMAVGTHGMWHRPWPGMDPATRAEELIEARLRLEEVVSSAVTDAACPFGRYDRQLLGHLRRLGYQRVYTSDRRQARLGNWLQPRFSVRRDDSPESLRTAVLGSPGLASRARQNIGGMVKRLR